MKLLLNTKHDPRSQTFQICIMIYYETNRVELLFTRFTECHGLVDIAPVLYSGGSSFTSRFC